MLPWRSVAAVPRLGVGLRADRARQRIRYDRLFIWFRSVFVSAAAATAAAVAFVLATTITTTTVAFILAATAASPSPLVVRTRR